MCNYFSRHLRLRPGIGIVFGLLMTGCLATGGFGAALHDPSKGGADRLARPQVSEFPNWGIEVHKINKLWLAVSNGGSFGIGFANTLTDPETGLPAPSCEYPAGSNITYLYIASLWAGAVVGRDTLVSVGFDGNYFVRELWPDAGEGGAFERRSNLKTSVEYSPDAVSEQDFICTFTDTFTDGGLTGRDPLDNRLHIPLGLEVRQRSYAWSYDYAEDFIVLDYTIRNIYPYPLRNLYLGLYVDADVYHESRQGGGGGWSDDICGYLHAVPSREPPGFLDTVRIAWNADNDGDPNPSAANAFDFTSATGITGTAVLRTPNPDLQYAFNWWIANNSSDLDWGPRQAGTDEHPFRDFGTGLGSPNGDKNKYYTLSSNEFDYDQLESAVNHSSQGWLEPRREAPDFADGFDNRYLFSFGPFTVEPGDTLPVTLAYVAGENFHKNSLNFVDNWDPYNPGPFISELDFSDLGTNARWAHWVFDNPGYDTDGDGDSGKVRWLIDSTGADSTSYFYAGDGVPDFRGASPPPPPILTVIPEYGQLRIRWNGEITEKNVDIFSGLKDFEGYRVYYGLSRRASDYVLLAGYDRDNFNMFTWDPVMRRWAISDEPLTRDSLAILFGDRLDPEVYDDGDNPFEDGGAYYYFSRQDWNQSDLSNLNGIHRLYPEAELSDASDTTDEGFHRYYEYEYILDNLQPSVPCYVSVTAFDFGSRRVAISSLESSPNLNAVLAYPLPGADLVEAQGLSVIVYPNPYRIDGGYAAAGYENRDRTRSAERARKIHFANLPSICTIRIYTLSGDLVKEIKHYYPEGGPTAQHESWDVISRNTQAVTTGVYLFQVSSETGDQIGKIVIMK